MDPKDKLNIHRPETDPVKAAEEEAKALEAMQEGATDAPPALDADNTTHNIHRPETDPVKAAEEEAKAIEAMKGSDVGPTDALDAAKKAIDPKYLKSFRTGSINTPIFHPPQE